MGDRLAGRPGAVARAAAARPRVRARPAAAGPPAGGRGTARGARRRHRPADAAAGRVAGAPRRAAARARGRGRRGRRRRDPHPRRARCRRAGLGPRRRPRGRPRRAAGPAAARWPGGSPDDVVEAVGRIADTLLDTLPRVTGSFDQEQAVLRTATDYLPRTLQAYAALPRPWAETHRLPDGTTPLDALRAQLGRARAGHDADARRRGRRGRLGAARQRQLPRRPVRDLEHRPAGVSRAAGQGQPATPTGASGTLRSARNWTTSSSRPRSR